MKEWNLQNQLTEGDDKKLFRARTSKRGYKNNRIPDIRKTIINIWEILSALFQPNTPRKSCNSI